jgi:Spy/CpxP family protein refolding chaperone
MMPSRIQTIILLTSLMTLGGIEAMAQKSLSADTSGNGELVNSLLAPMTEQLRLTPEQQSQIEAIAQNDYVRGQALVFRLNQMTAELDREQLKESFDEDKVRALASQAGQLMAEIIVVKLRVKTKVIALLTPGQKAIVEQQLLLNRKTNDASPIY